MTLVLAGVRPEEIAEWQEGPVAPAAALSFAASADAQGQAVERAVDTAKRVAARGGHARRADRHASTACTRQAARKALAAARNLRDGGSLTVIATASSPFGGETTVIALDVALTSTGRQPILDLRQQRHAAARAARRRGRRRGDRAGPRGGAGRPRARRRAGSRTLALAALPGAGRRPGPRRARARARSARRRGRRLHVGEAAGLLVEGDVQLALVDALVEPRAAEHQAAQPVHQRALGRPDQLGPAVVDVLAERRGGVGDLAVDGEVDEVFELLLARGARRRTRASAPPARSARRSPPR